MSDDKYRILKHGELIKEGDEVDACANPWRGNPKWGPTKAEGQFAPDPRYPAHRIYRRKIESDGVN
jgi:hypothetical protein